MNEPTTDSCADKNWLERKNKADEILKLLDGMSYPDASRVLDMAKANLWTHAVINVKGAENE